MNYRKLGKTGIEISEISLGGVPLDDSERKAVVSQETITSVIHKAVDSGINFMDMCPVASPAVRDKMGAAIKGIREKLMISCHYGATWKNGEFFKTREPKLTRASFEDLLDRLDTDHVDILMFSWIDNDDDFEAAFDSRGYLDFALKLKREGKTRIITLSTHRISIAEKAIGSGHVDAIMFPVNPAHDMLPADFGLKEMWNGETYQQLSMNPAMERRDFYHTCESNGIGIIAMKPFAGGLLLKDGQIPDFLKGKGLENPAGIALTPVQCVSYALSQPGVDTALVGCGTAEELESALRYIDADQDERDFSSIDKAALWKLRRSCVYCNHCLPCPVGIEIGATLKLQDAAAFGSVEAVAAGYEELDVKASDCTECGICEERCPFGVPVMERIKQIAEAFTA